MTRPDASGFIASDAFDMMLGAHVQTTKNVEDNELAERMSGVKVVNPYQLSNIIEDITGYSWTMNGVNILTNQGLGVPVLLGGLDGDNVSKRNCRL